MVDYLRVSVTDRCNLRCIYCTPNHHLPTIDRQEILRFEEIIEIVRASAQLGIRKVRITGGEPLIRRGIGQLLRELSQIEGIKDHAITTNGVLLQARLDDILDSAFRRINISLDTLDEGIYKNMMGSPSLWQVLNGIEKAISNNLIIKINSVAWPDLGIFNAFSLANYAIENKVELRFIEPMSLGGTGIDNSHRFTEIKQSVVDAFGLVYLGVEGVAEVYKNSQGAKIGFIQPSREHFCDHCSKVRLSADGKIRLCLFSSNTIDLKDVLRKGKDVKEVLRMAFDQKERETTRGKGIIHTMRNIGG